MISYSSRVCGKPFDDPKGCWRREGGINVTVILQFAAHRSQASKIKGDVSKNGIHVTLSSISSDDEKCLRDTVAATPSPIKREVKCTDDKH